MKFEVIRKETNKIRVTIAAERTTIKLPSYLPEEDEQTLVQFVRRIEDDVRSRFPKTMRGQAYYNNFENKWGRLVLVADSKKEKVIYRIDTR